MRDSTVMGPLGIALDSISDEEVVLSCTITDAVRQPFGLLHGGVSLLMAESAASLHAAWLADLSQTAPVGIDVSGTHLRGATKGVIYARARVLRRTRAFVFHDVEISHLEPDAHSTRCNRGVSGAGDQLLQAARRDTGERPSRVTWTKEGRRRRRPLIIGCPPGRSHLVC